MAKMASLAEVLKAYPNNVAWMLFDGVVTVYDGEKVVETIVLERA